MATTPETQTMKARNRAALLDALKNAQAVETLDDGDWSKDGKCLLLVEASDHNGSYYKVRRTRAGAAVTFACSCKWGRSNCLAGWRTNDLACSPCRHMLLAHFMTLDDATQQRLIAADTDLAAALAVWEKGNACTVPPAATPAPPPPPPPVEELTKLGDRPILSKAERIRRGQEATDLLFAAR